MSGALKLVFHGAISGVIAAKGAPMSEVVALLVGAFEVGGAVLLSTNIRLVEVSLALGAWSLLTAMMFHDFWNTVGMDQQMQLANF